jgi:thioredoxin 1
VKSTWKVGLLLLGLAVAGAAACTRSEAAQPATIQPGAALPAATGRLPRLVFFMNPNGLPCQMQDRVLQEMSGELRPKVEVVYVRTTNPNDLAAFQHYGIRSLPALILTDPAGRELRRATPGIQSAAQLRQLVAP